MDFDFTEFFKKYEAIAAKVDEAFGRIKSAYPEAVACEPGCTDCCYALFDLTLIEALYLNHHFKETFSGSELASMLEKANLSDRQIYKLKRKAFRSAKEDGRSEEEVVEEMGKERIRCPLLNDSKRCDLYVHRPVACRIYGAPLAIGGKGRTCGQSGFVPGERYPTINMDIIHDQLLKLSAELVEAIGSKHVRMGDLLVPVSMAILTDYNEEYLGLKTEENSEEESS